MKAKKSTAKKVTPPHKPGEWADYGELLATLSGLLMASTKPEYRKKKAWCAYLTFNVGEGFGFQGIVLESSSPASEARKRRVLFERNWY
jgi:hypothetical protein